MNIGKMCTGCKKTKLTNQFSKCSASPDKLQYQCKDCNKITSAKFRELRPEYAGEWDKANPGAKLKITTRWIDNNYHKWYSKIQEIQASWGAGVYCIVNRITGDVYVGASKNLRFRRYQHFSKGGLHTNKNLYAAIKHYGKSQFDFYILEQVNDLNLIRERERAWIKHLDPAYNIIKYA